MGGTIDEDTPYEWGVKPTYEDVSSAQKSLVTIVNASHTIFNPTCNNIPWAPDLGDYYGWLCLQKVWDKERGLDLIHHFSTAFLLDQLKGDKAAHKALLPDAVNFPGIDYKTTMK